MELQVEQRMNFQRIRLAAAASDGGSFAAQDTAEGAVVTAAGGTADALSEAAVQSGFSLGSSLQRRFSGFEMCSCVMAAAAQDTVVERAVMTAA